MKTLKQQSKEAPKFVLYTNEFGFDIFINIDTCTEDKIEKATEFSVGFDNPELKLAYWNFQTGYNLIVKYI